MRFTVNTRELNEAISIVSRALPAHSSLPILDGIYVYASGSTLFMKCSDLNLQIETELAAIVDEEGGAVLPGRLFSELVKKLNGESVDIEKDGGKVFVKSGRVKTSLQIGSAEEYPEMRRVNDEFSADISQSVLRSMIKDTIFSVSVDDTKPVLNGICLDFDEDRSLKMISLDGFRLAMRKEKLNTCTGKRRVVIPTKAMQEIANILSQEPEDMIKLVFSSTHIKLDFGYTKLLSRLLDGEFIDYERLLPVNQASHALIECRELQMSVERASLIAKEDKTNRIKFDFSEDKLSLTANSEMGSLDEEMPIKLMGKPLEIAFNAKYILDILKVIDDEMIYIRMNSSVTPCSIEPVDGDAFYYMMMPVRLFNGL